MIALGVDPGLHTTAWAIVSIWDDKRHDLIHGPCQFMRGDLKVLDVGVWQTDPVRGCPYPAVPMTQAITDTWSMWNPHRFVVESQQVYDRLDIDPKTGKSKSKGDPADLIHLATISGAVLREIGRRSVPTEAIYNPVPFAWKGNVEKVVPQARACLRLGWEFKTMGGKDVKKQYAVPMAPPFRGYTAEDWKNIMDAIAMAIWGLRQ